MSINDATTIIEHNAKDVYADLIKAANETAATVGEQTWSEVYGDNFAGINENQIPQFNSAITRYVGTINMILNQMNAQQDAIDDAVKGKPAEAIKDFIDATKQIAKAYVKTINSEIRLLAEANENWNKTTGQIASNLSTDAEKLREIARGIQLDNGSGGDAPGGGGPATLENS